MNKKIISALFSMFVAGMMAFPQFAHADITSGLIDHWKFDDCSGTTAADSVGGNTVNLTGTPSWTTGKIGTCAITWNGTSQYGLTASNVSLPGNFTISAWIKPNGAQTAFFRVVEQSFSSAFSINGTSDASQYQFIMQNGPSGIGGTVTSGSWVLVTAVFDGVPKLYINGSFIGSGSSATSGFNLPMYFATYFGSPGSNLLKGDMDDVCIYGRALTDQDVTDLYNSTTGCSAASARATSWKIQVPPNLLALSTGLVGWWTFDGKDTNWKADTTTDKSGNGNTGTLMNMSTTSSPTIGKLGQALKFDGVDDYVSVNHSSSIDDLGAETYSAWVYATAFNTSPRILSKGDRKLLRLNKLDFGHKVTFTVMYSTTDLSVSTNEAVPLNKWTHITATWNGTNAASGVHIYLNGVEATYAESIDGVGSPDSDSAYGFVIGDDYYGSSATKWIGPIDDTRIYNRVLSATEVGQLYNANKTIVRSSCTSSYANTGGTGNRTGIITVDSPAVPNQIINGPFSDFVDGDTTSNNRFYFQGRTLDASTYWVSFDFGSGHKPVITESKFYQQDSTSQGVWQWQGSNDNSSWVNIGSTFNLVTAATTVNTSLSANKKGYRYYRMLGMSGTTSNGPWAYQMEFKICGY